MPNSGIQYHTKFLCKYTTIFKLCKLLGNIKNIRDSFQTLKIEIVTFMYFSATNYTKIKLYILKYRYKQ